MSRTEAIQEKIEMLNAIRGIMEDLERNRGWCVEVYDDEEAENYGQEKPLSEYTADWNARKVAIYDDLLDYLSKKAK